MLRIYYNLIVVFILFILLLSLTDCTSSTTEPESETVEVLFIYDKPISNEYSFSATAEITWGGTVKQVVNSPYGETIRVPYDETIYVEYTRYRNFNYDRKIRKDKRFTENSTWRL